MGLRLMNAKYLIWIFSFLLCGHHLIAADEVPRISNKAALIEDCLQLIQRYGDTTRRDPVMGMLGAEYLPQTIRDLKVKAVMVSRTQVWIYISESAVDNPFGYIVTSDEDIALQGVKSEWTAKRFMNVRRISKRLYQFTVPEDRDASNNPIPAIDEVPLIINVVQETKLRMKTIVIPRAHIRQPSLRVVVEFLEAVVNTRDPEGPDFRMIVSLTCVPERERFRRRPPATANDPWGEDNPWADDIEVYEPPAPLCGGHHTLSRPLNFRRVSVYNVLTQIIEQANLVYRIDDSGIVFIECGHLMNQGKKDIDNDVY